MANGEVIINRRDFLKIATAAAGAVVGYKLFQKDVDKFLYNLINDEPQPRTPLPVVNETAVPTATPEPDYLMYDGIKVIGDEQFQKDVVMTLEFGKKYSLPDYEFIKKNTKEIELASVEKMFAGDGYTSVNKNWFHELIEQNDIKTGIYAFSHESGHNYADSNPQVKSDTTYDAETYANTFYLKASANLSYVNQSEIEKFYKEFNFSQFKN